MNEFSLIAEYFSDCGHSQYATELGIGDDAAIVSLSKDEQLVMTMDTLIEGVHFPVSTCAADIALKSLAVNLSDLAAMGAEPAWFLLSLSLPEVDQTWLKAFADSLKQQAELYAIRLIGGDTCKGALSITIQATGVIQQTAIRRSTAQLGDHIFVSGKLGAAALGLASVQNKLKLADDEAKDYIEALNRPTARFDISRIVKLYAHSMIDLSDGLLADLGHILNASHCGAELYLDAIPMPFCVRNLAQFEYSLTGGDDYELCFT
ncbi:MAG: thiamine-phosphate kinase, partial [Gammaproteobacteria bacterium]|nr:thiamine-phosphate kinase [Gammaproteobacteria bacterium]